MSENTKPDGGSAFPIPAGENVDGRHPPVRGMTLRDYFAAKALEPVTLMSWLDLDYNPQDGLSIIENNARLAYQIADAMIAARGAA